MSIQPGRRVGVAFVGMGGAVATTAIAGIEMIKSGSNRLDGLPLAGHAVAGMVGYKDLVFGGWDLNGDDLGAAATGHGVLTRQDIENGAQVLNGMKPWPAVGSAKFCKNIDGGNRIVAKDHREAVDCIAGDLKRFREESGVDDVVVVNLASTERWPDLDDPTLNSAAAFERGLDSSDEAISPAMLYAYAAIKNGIPYANFTPSVAADVPALIDLAKQLNVPVAGKDGKTGQTMMKTVLAPALKARALHVDGWFSTNILGNRDGLALNDKDSLQSKLNTKGTVLDSILGYPVEDHLVHIHYYRPRGDDKEAWDNIDVTGFLGQRMQIKVNFLCKDSILAAPLVIEIARVLDLAKKRGDGGVQEQLSTFFKAPMVKNGHGPEHAFGVQERMLLDWLGVH
ncbi:MULTISPECIES: inositol-3-phosphate synthase [Methylobacterium]|jgi:myo-inositol-1-phosphate synthase|uniref:Inositol-3-phosphate synthase n=2 Tax=Methylobacterium TaxID=407 RepID=A0A0C6FIU8_9HYPH|nr:MULTISPECIES: inositol-3-phosphate synthase [Methylobacterium]MBZ6412506.1 inositol-3-phosphate synthase [Methylobacterium sp.]MBK3395529.1 inositol-3-phosphate synthase [Methylobacterium ajmalii]MBK3408121.1 inositol-3-phosphate synthase [Methylobacterium ajmalii]MBK3421524.1 inositol-3-phosphate synthase [Methylobacterium ajmalii]SFF06451.1 myo-inositol-1-phosphate synthase [Methylobacterium sp. yr596]